MRLIVLLQAKNEERYLPGWLRNIEAAVDGIIALDDGSTDRTADLLSAHPKLLELIRNKPGLEWDERANQTALVQAGRKHGADWLLCLDADERMEQTFIRRAREILHQADADGVQALQFHLRDLWNQPHQYRVDGIWGRKSLTRLFKNVPGHKRSDPRKLHRFWIPMEIVANFEKLSRHCGLNIYHLSMMSAHDRRARVEKYERLDPQHLYQPIGYRYLEDETQLTVEAIPAGREFYPTPEAAPRVSVVIPVFNGERYLAEAIESVLNQTCPPAEIIVSDDGSTDGSARVAAHYAPGVRCVTRSNGGPAAALNSGIREASGDYLAFISADDVWVPQKLEWQFRELRSHTDCDLVFGHMQHFRSPELDPAVAATLHCPLDPMPAQAAGAVLVSRETFLRVGYFNEKWKAGEFMDWLARAHDHGLKSRMLDQVVSHRRVHGGNHTVRTPAVAGTYAAVLKANLDRRRKAGPPTVS